MNISKCFRIYRSKYSVYIPLSLKKRRYNFLVQIVAKSSETNEKLRKIVQIFFSRVISENSSKIDHILNTKMTITQKINIGKI